MVFWLPLRQSRWLHSLCLLQSGCALLALWQVAWPIPVRLVALLLVVAYARRKAPLPQSLLFDSKGLQLVFAGQVVPARLGAQCYCSELLVVLCLYEVPLQGEKGGRKRYLLLLPDSSDPDALRRLRVYLRWYAQAEV